MEQRSLNKHHDFMGNKNGFLNNLGPEPSAMAREYWDGGYPPEVSETPQGNTLIESDNEWNCYLLNNQSFHR